MFGITQGPSDSIASGRLVRLTAAVVALLAALVFAASAHGSAAGAAVRGADEALPSTEGSGSVPSVPGAEGTTPPAPTVQTPEGTPVTVPSLPAPEATPEALPAVPAPESAPEATPVIPAPENAPEAAPAIPAPEATPVIPAPESTPEAAPAVPAPESAPEPVPSAPPESAPQPVAPEGPPAVPSTGGPPPESTPTTVPLEAVPSTGPKEGGEALPPSTGPESAPLPTGQGSEAPAEKVTAGAGKEGTGGPGPGAGAAQPTGTLEHGAGQATELPSGAVISLAQVSTTAAPKELEQSLDLGGAAAPAAILVTSRPNRLSCELSALEGRMPPTCGAGLVGSERLLAASPVGYAVTSNALEPNVATGASTDGGHGGSAVLRLPVSPTPGPAPSGVSGAGGSAAGASGLALSGFLTLAGLLLLAAPRALRRLRLSCQPWRTACFVLIPERPG